MKNPSLRASQQGVTLIFVLILLVVLLMGGLSLVRTVDTGLIISGNLAFKRSATYSADFGLERARTWLMARGGDALAASLPNEGYYASRQDSITDFTTQVNWDGTGGALTKARSVGQDSAGNSVAYVIHRLCFQDGEPGTVTNPCESASGGGGGGSTKAGFGYGGGILSGGSAFLYRITVRVSGPRGTQSFVQGVLIL